MIESFTVKKLKSLKLGESYRYYRGNLPEDIARSESDSCSEAAERYTTLLKSIRNTAETLQIAGRIQLFEEKTEVVINQRTKEGTLAPIPVKVIDYLAIGV